jgi:DNA processing protein
MAGPDVELLEALRLALVPGIGPKTQRALLGAFGSPAEVLAAGSAALQQVDGIGPKLARAIVEARDSEEALREFEACARAGVTLVRHGTPAYPRPLAEIPDPPLILYTRGTLAARDELAVAIVGSRRCTLYGKQQAERLARALAQAGMTIVSGLARGIDGAAHRGAMEGGGRTIAVLATGLAKIYPPEHEPLADEVAAHGALVTESPLFREALPGLFPQRNRIISGLSTGVIIVEASRNSGALHTARHAMEQGREVFAVPGRIDSLASEGCHDLIRDGATLLRSVDDVLEGLGPLVRPVSSETNGQVLSPRELALNDQEREILNHVTLDPRPIDEVLRAAGLESARVLSTLTVLEVKRMIRRLPGGMVVRSSH